MQTVEDWYNSLPLVTKSYWSVAVVTSLAATIRLIPSYYLYLDWSIVINKFQIWRILTNFIFFAELSPMTAMYLIFMLTLLVRHGSELEKEFYTGFQGFCNYIWLYLFGMITLLIIGGYFLNIPLLGPAFVFMILYILSRKDPHKATSFYGFLFQRWHLPFLYLAVSLILGGPLESEVLGIIIGHLWVFLSEIVPRVYGKSIVTPTPAWIGQFVVNYAPKVATVAAGYNPSGVIHNRDQAPPRPNAGWMRGPGYRLDQ